MPNEKMQSVFLGSPAFTVSKARVPNEKMQSCISIMVGEKERGKVEKKKRIRGYVRSPKAFQKNALLQAHELSRLRPHTSGHSSVQTKAQSRGPARCSSEEAGNEAKRFKKEDVQPNRVHVY